jgi:hypothetical protein
MLEIITTPSGSLSIQLEYIHPEYDGIHSLLNFASRKNTKRGFLFVSKILGKHIPTKPSTMRKSYNILANLVTSTQGNSLVIGMAETAIGLGAGVADSLSRINENANVYFQSTTRQKLDDHIWFSISEDHCHAPSHIIYEPESQLLNPIINCKHLVLVDDEISTGRTLLQLLKGYIDKLNLIESVDIISLVSWLDTEKTENFKESIHKYCISMSKDSPNINFICLAKGSFKYEKNESFNFDLPAKTDSYLETRNSSAITGRRGLRMPIELPIMKMDDYQSIQKPISIVGYCENVFVPFLKAEAIEKSTSKEVYFQSFTRSPVFVDGEVIRSINTIDVRREDQPESEHYIYNLDPYSNHIIFEHE